MSKRILSLVLALTLVLGSMSMAFADVDVTTDVEGENLTDAVTRLNELEILEGYEDGTFKPENDITRAEFAAVVSRARGLEAAAKNATGKTVFGDVIPGGWASGYINVAEGAGLIKGMGVVNGVNTFGPELNVTYEQAVTMVVRALGYESLAQKNGAYPNGYLVVASQTGLLKDVKGGEMGKKASRGLVAQLVDNALDIPKMIDVGYGPIVSGDNNTEERFLFDDMQLDKIEGQLKSDSDKNKVTIDGEDRNEKKLNKSLKVVTDNFDYAGLDGLKVEVWYNNKDEVKTVKVLSDYTVKYDAIEVNLNKGKYGELTTVTEDETYDLNEKVTVKGDTSSKSNLNSEYDFAKIVFDEYGDVTWLEVYDFGEEILVDEVKGNNVLGYDNEELVDANDYTIMKNGKQISYKALNDKDLVLYNSEEEYAAVVTNIVKGELDRVYLDSFRFEGKNYSNAGVKYIDGKDLADIDEDVLDEMKDNGEITVYFDFKNDPVIINGIVEEVASSYVMLTDTSVDEITRGKTTVTFDYLNSQGTKVKNDIEVDNVGTLNEDVDLDIMENGSLVDKDIAQFKSFATKGKVFKVSTNAKNELTKIEDVKSGTAINSANDNEFDLSDSYVQGYKLQNRTTVFWSDNETDLDKYKVVTLEEAKKSFDKVEKGSIYYDKDGNIVAIVAEETDMDDEGEWETGVVTDVRKTSDDYYVDFAINGVEKTYKAADKSTVTGKNLLNDLIGKDDAVLSLKIDENNQIKAIEKPDTANNIMKTLTLGDNITSTRIEGADYRYTVEGKYYEIKSGEYEVASSNKFKGKEATLYFKRGSDKFVSAVVLGTDQIGSVSTDGTVTYIDTTATNPYVIIGDKEIEVIGSAFEFFGNGAIAVNDKIAFELSAGGKMFKITAIDGNVTLDASDSYSTFADLTVGGNLTIVDTGTVTASNVTVKGKLVVGDGANATVLKATNFDVTGTTEVKAAADATFNSRLRGDVTVAGTATFKNVEMDGDLDVTAGSATFEETVTVEGTITGASNITVTDADAATTTLVNDAAALEAAQSTVNNVAFTTGAPVGEVRLSNTATTLEYSLNGATYVDCDATNTDIEANIGDEIVVRVKATPAANKTLTVAASNITQVTMSGAAISAATDIITGLTDGVDYEIFVGSDWVTYTADSDGEIKAAVHGQDWSQSGTLDIRIKATTEKPASTVQTITVGA